MLSFLVKRVIAKWRLQRKIGVRSDIWTRTQLCANPVKADLNLVFGVIFKAKRRHLEEPILTQQCR